MAPPARNHAILSALSLALFIGLMVEVMAGNTLAFDTFLRNQIHSRAFDPLTSFMKFVTTFGASDRIVPACAVISVVLWREGRRRHAWTLALLVVVGYLFEGTLKAAVGRHRPDAFFGLISPTTFSFPSGHALMSTVFYGTLAYISSGFAASFGRRVLIWTSAVITIVLICFSRVYLGVHYPTDIAGGVLIACFWINAVLACAKLP